MRKSARNGEFDDPSQIVGLEGQACGDEDDNLDVLGPGPDDDLPGDGRGGENEQETETE